MKVIFLELVNLSISASWLILAILLLRPILKKAPKWVNPILWCLVGIRLLVPYSIESSVSLIPTTEVISSTILYEQTLNVDMSIINNIINTDGVTSDLADIEVYQNPLPNLISVLATIWIVVCVLFFLYAIFSYLYIRNRVKTAIKIKDNIYQCEYIKTPFVLGLFRPRIYVPFSIEEKRIEHVIAHEQTHIKRHDHWIKPIAFLVLSIYWFQPLLWIAYVLLCKDIELACDERVICQLKPEQRADYSEVLLFYSDNHYMRKLMMICPLAFGEVGVKERVRSVISYKKPAVWMIEIAILSCVIIGICFLTNPTTKKNPNAPFGILYETVAPLYGLNLDTSFSINEKKQTQYYIHENKLYTKNDVLVLPRNDSWIEVGALQEIEMKEENFDSYFSNNGMKGKDFNSAKMIRLNNEKMWRVIYENKRYNSYSNRLNVKNYMYYILLQKDGSIYLACGKLNQEDETLDNHFKFSFAFQLKESIVGENTIEDIVADCKQATRKKEQEIESIKATIRQYEQEQQAMQLYKAILQDKTKVEKLVSESTEIYLNTTCILKINQAKNPMDIKPNENQSKILVYLQKNKDTIQIFVENQTNDYVEVNVEDFSSNDNEKHCLYNIRTGPEMISVYVVNHIMDTEEIEIKSMHWRNKDWQQKVGGIM